MPRRRTSVGDLRDTTFDRLPMTSDQRPVNQTLRRSWLAVAIVAGGILGLPAGADAAEWAAMLLAQAAGPAPNTISRGPGMYLSLLKFIPVLLVYILWAWTTYWVDDDMRELDNRKFEMWNSVVFFTGLLGF